MYKRQYSGAAGSPSSRVPSSILSSDYCMCEVSHSVSMSTWVSLGFSTLLPPPKNMAIAGLAKITCPWVYMSALYGVGMFLGNLPDQRKAFTKNGQLQ